MLLLTLIVAGIMVARSVAVVQVDIQRRELVDVLEHDRARLSRRQTVSQTLDNLDTLYFANITLGTPPQNLRMHIDTGSSDLWCNSPRSTLCRSRFSSCEESGTYDSTASSTYKFVNDDFSISYLDGTGASGDYVSDTVGIGGQTINDLQFGVGNRSSSEQGVLGIGYTLNEVQVHRGSGVPYPNLPQLMVDTGLIKSNAYSLWLNDLDASTGQILFGGVNTDKYYGSLQAMPILPVDGQYTQFLIVLSSISLDGTEIGSSTSLPTAVVLDSGTTLMYLPKDIAQQIHSQVGAVAAPSSIIAYVPCALRHENRTLDFAFNGIEISVPFNEIVLDSQTASGGRQFDDGTPACLFGIAPNNGGPAVLGDTFLRSAYVVYDLANNEIALAQTNFNSTTDNIKEILAGPRGVPDAKLVSNPKTKVHGLENGAARLADMVISG